MRLHVTAARTLDSHTVVVDGPDVSGVAAWRGDGEPPVDAAVDVEIDIADEVSWGDIVRDSEKIDACVQSAQGSDQLVVRGVVDEVDQLGVLVLNVAGAIVLIETIGEPPEGVVGSTVVIVTRRASVFPTGI